MNLNNNEKMAILAVLADAICSHMENETLQSAYQKIYAEWNKEIKEKESNGHDATNSETLNHDEV